MAAERGKGSDRLGGLVGWRRGLATPVASGADFTDAVHSVDVGGSGRAELAEATRAAGVVFRVRDVQGAKQSHDYSRGTERERSPARRQHPNDLSESNSRD